jgi:hypothetical protein
VIGETDLSIEHAAPASCASHPIATMTCISNHAFCTREQSIGPDAPTIGYRGQRIAPAYHPKTTAWTNIPHLVIRETHRMSSDVTVARPQRADFG